MKTYPCNPGLSVSLLPYFVWKSQTIKGTFLSFSISREWIDVNEYMIELWCFWRTSESHPSLSSWYNVRNSFCYRIENSWCFMYKILGHTGPLGKKNLNFFVSLGITETWGLSELSVYTEVVLLKTFTQHFELCATPNNEEVMKFYNLIYCLTKISIRAKRSISRVFSLFIVPSPFFVHCPYKGRINRAESVLTGLKPY